MRKIATVIVVAISLVTGVAAQDIHVGPYLLFKGGTNSGNIPEGTKTAANFNGIPDFGVTGRWMFDKNSALGFLLDLGYSTYSFRMRPESESIANDDNTIVFKPSYFSLVPSFYFSGVTLGFAFGFPMAYSVQTVSGTEMSGQFLGDVQDLNGPSVEIRLGAIINAWKTETGTLGVVLQAGYMLTGTFKPEYFQPGEYFSNEENNPNIISAGIGLNYLFDLKNL